MTLSLPILIHSPWLSHKCVKGWDESCHCSCNILSEVEPLNLSLSSAICYLLTLLTVICMCQCFKIFQVLSVVNSNDAGINA